MDSTELRLILLGLGIILVIGIYAWEKSKRQRRSTRERLAAVSVKPSRREARKFGDRFTRHTPKPSEPEETHERQEPVLSEAVSDMESVHLEKQPVPPTDESTEKTVDMGDSQAGASDAKPSPQAPQVIAFHVVARVGQEFDGDAIMSAARDLALYPGSMDVFHKTDEDSGESIFSMANMVKPGTFPFSSMSDFSSPGLVLFAQLPGPRTAQVLLDDMLAVADRLAALLDGRVQDDQRTSLTPDKIDALRQRLLETP